MLGMNLKKIHLLWLVTFVTGFELFSTGNQWCINSESLWSMTFSFSQNNLAMNWKNLISCMYFVGWLLIDKYKIDVVKVEGKIKKYRVIYVQGIFIKIFS